MRPAHHSGEEPQAVAQPTTYHLVRTPNEAGTATAVANAELAEVVNQNSSPTSEVDDRVPMSLNFNA